MGCCFSCGSSDEGSENAKETVYKYDNSGFTNPVIQSPIATVSDVAKDYLKQDGLNKDGEIRVIPKISVTLATTETNENVIENEHYYGPGSGLDNCAFDYTDGGKLNLDDYEEYPNYEPLRRMSADIREQKEKEAARRILKEKDAQIERNEENAGASGFNEKVQIDKEPNNLEANGNVDLTTTSVGTVYHTAMGVPKENAEIDEEGLATKTTVTVEVHSTSRMDAAKSELPQASTIELPEDASRKFSQLAPAPKNNPLATKLGQFSITPTEGQVNANKATAVQNPSFSLEPENTLSVIDEASSRKFSQLPPAPSNSPHAVQVGEKFTMIPTEADH